MNTLITPNPVLFSPLPVLGERVRVRGDSQTPSAFEGQNFPSPLPSPRVQGEGGRATRARRGFTLIEVLAAMLLMAIVLPPVMEGVALATRAASDARRRTEAAGLAEEKLSELLATSQWTGGSLSGDFGAGWPDYHWQANVYGWAADTTTQSLQQIDLNVTWTSRGHQQSITLSTLAFTPVSSSS